jgi:hypothetical protein
LIAVERAIESGEAKKEREVEEFAFDSLHLEVVHANGSQGGASLGLVGTGSVTRTAFSLEGAELDEATLPFRSVFVMAQPTGERWMLVDVFEVP